MHRLCKFFISDIVAGENILQNGFFPICKEGDRASHGVLFAPNGSCKTTLLSFLLSVFCPEQRRFVQHLQSGGDKSMDQYLIPGRPAIVLADLVVSLEPTLFEAEPEEHLVIGQLLYRHKSALNRIDRTYFIANEPDFFNELRSRWKGLLDQDQPYTAVRDFLMSRVLQTSSQKEWEDKLENIGLDPWLVNRQVDFARSEGGIKDAFKFKSESEFLSFFLGCVTDLEEAVKLRDNTTQNIEKMRNRPEKKAQLDAARLLKGRIADFDQRGKGWRDAQKEVKECQLQLGEATHLLRHAEQAARKSLTQCQGTLEKARKEKEAAFNRVEVACANGVQVEATDQELQVETLKQKIKQAAAAVAGGEGERKALKAADLTALIRKNRAEIETREQALTTKDAKLEPIRMQISLRAAQYHARLDHERGQLESAIHSLEKEKKITCHQQEESGRGLKALRGELEGTREEMARLTALIRSGVEASEALQLKADEKPSEALERLGREFESTGAKIIEIEKRIAEVEKGLAEADHRWQDLQRTRVERDAALKQARDQVAREAEERGALLADSNLVTLAGSADFEPTRVELASRVQEVISRNREKLEALQIKRLTVQNELTRLEGIDTLAVDSQTWRLIEHYISQGLSPAEIKAFPEYLSALYEDPEEIADFLQRDPARFTGIMAAGEGVVERIKELPVPQWLHKPVVISIPSPLDDVAPIDHCVIVPADARVYSRNYLEKEREKLLDELESLEKAFSELQAKLRSMEESGHRLKAYREKYRDRAAVESLSRQVTAIEGELGKNREKILALEKEKEALFRQKKELEKESHLRAAEEARLKQQLQQVESWLRQYGELEAWRKKQGREEQRGVELKNRIASAEEDEKELGAKAGQLIEKLAQKKTELKTLDEKAGKVPLSTPVNLAEEQQREAFSLALDALERLHEEALDCQRRVAGELGIESLEKELENLQRDYQRDMAELESFRRENPYDEELADRWASQSIREREERLQELDGIIKENTRLEGGFNNQVENQQKSLENCLKQLKQKARKGILPDVSPEELERGDLEALRHRFSYEEKEHRDEYERLGKQIARLEKELGKSRDWCNKVELGLAGTKSHDSHWDSGSPRLAWPELVEIEDPLAAVEAFLEMVEQINGAEKKAANELESNRRKISSAFDRLQNSLRDEELRKRLPAVVDELRCHDAETLGTQSEELIEKCENLACNIESDLDRSSRFVNSLIDMMLQHSRMCHQKLQAAAKKLMPDNVYVYGGKAILRAGMRLDFARHDEAFRQSVDNWLHELIEQNRIPEVNARAGNVLGAELLYRLLRAATGKNEFGIRLLKCDDTGRHYEAVGKDLGSGGEALTTAVLLYSLLTSMRQKRRNKRDDRLPAFLLADNPLGVCNRSDFLDAQLKVAEAMGIQCVYFTGINDRESLGLFEHRVAIRKSGRQLVIDSKNYNILEVIEQSVENVKKI